MTADNQLRASPPNLTAPGRPGLLPPLALGVRFHDRDELRTVRDNAAKYPQVPTTPQRAHAGKITGARSPPHQAHEHTEPPPSGEGRRPPQGCLESGASPRRGLTAHS